MNNSKKTLKTKRIFKSITGKLLLTIGILLILSQIASTSINLLTAKKSQEDQIFKTFSSDVKGISYTIHYAVQDELAKLDRFIYDPNFSDFATVDINKIKNNDSKVKDSQKQITDAFKKQMESDSIFNEYIVNKDGIVVATGDPTAQFCDVSTRDYFKELKNGKDSVVSNLLISNEAGAKPIIVLAKSIYDKNHNFVGIIGKDITADEFANILKTYNHDRYNVFLTDSTSNVIFNVNKELVGKPLNLNIEKSEKLSENSEAIYYNYNGEDKIGVKTIIPGLNWTVCSTGYVTDIMAPIRSLLYSSLLSTIVILILAIIATVFVSKNFTKPILKLKDYTKRLANGDLSFKISDINSGDEIEDLAKEVNIAVSNLSKTLLNIQGSINTVNEQSSNLSAVNEELSATNSEIVLAINDISERICDSANQANDCESKTKELEEAMITLDNHNHIMVDRSDDVVNALANNNSNLDNLLDSKEESSKSFIELKKTIDDLILGVNNIGNFLEVINQIAEQTNLLSLNAAIEAARAGEAGKGFAVVSEEIRKLSSDTQVATLNIGKIISKIDSLVKNTKNTLNTTEKLNINENEYFTLMESSFTEMQSSLKEMVNITQNISNEISTVNNKKDEVLKNISEVASVSQQIAAITEEVNASANEQSSTFDTINNSAQELLYTAEDVRDKVLKFTLD
ncbi:methyl-accepting chemotaxis protein [Clostridium chrysemydis]|uniref:methyl-accepting chemotaxis protein n=1 Tax=Clostridium chrysemydis TaxID=2665504 RepID=UPI0018846C3D|nr:methyl-accepting chemotaxis protein [Clostridium chrysemydis]